MFADLSAMGKSPPLVQPFKKKYFGFSETQIRSRTVAVSPTEGRIMIVANAGWDAVDAGSVRRALGVLDETLIAYGEVVWS
jgi:hypothetical protein